jgi:hypothetical protein
MKNLKNPDPSKFDLVTDPKKGQYLRKKRWGRRTKAEMAEARTLDPRGFRCPPMVHHADPMGAYAERLEEEGIPYVEVTDPALEN